MTDAVATAVCAAPVRGEEPGRDRGRRKPAIYVVSVLWTLVVLLPLYWVLVTSFKLAVEVDSGPLLSALHRFQPTLDAWNFHAAQQHARALHQLGDRRGAIEHAARPAYWLACRLCAGPHSLPGQACGRAHLPRPARRRRHRGGGAWGSLAGGRRGGDCAFPPGARHVRAALQCGRRQQRHRILDDLQPDHAADCRGVADLRDVPAVSNCWTRRSR